MQSKKHKLIVSKFLFKTSLLINKVLLEKDNITEY